MKAARKFLFIPLSSPGYVFPAIRLAHLLQERGHEVRFVTAVEHVQLLGCYGIQAFGVRNDRVPFLDPSQWFKPDNARDEARVLRGIVDQYRPEVIVTSPLVLGAFAVAAEVGVPLVNLGFTEYLYPGPDGQDAHKRWRLDSITDYYNAYLAALGRPPVPAGPAESPLLGDRYLLRSVVELSDARHLPEKVRYVGALYWEPAYVNVPLRRFLDEARARRSPIVYVQIGRLFDDHALWTGLLRALSQIDASYVIDLGRADYMRGPQAFPPASFVSPFVPLGAIADDVRVVLCSGQSTTVLSALVHGKPILAIPHAADAHELAHRLEAKGLALGIHGKEALTPAALAAHLDRLLGGEQEAAIHRFRALFAAVDDETIVDAATPG